MYARVSTLSVPPERADVARRHIAEQAVPAARDLPGLARAFWLSDAASGRVVAVTLYETEADLVGNRSAANAIREGSVEVAGGSVRSVEEFEVIAEIQPSDRKEDGMEQNKDVARRIYEEVINKRDLDLLDELVEPDYIEHDPLPGQRVGLDGIRDRFSMLIQGLDPHFTIEDVIGEGDKVVVHWTNSGTNVGDFLGIPATGRSFSIHGIDIYRLEGGKLAEHWHVVDMFSQMQQLGLLPGPGTG